jgi:hypothetical protein
MNRKSKHAVSPDYLIDIIILLTAAIAAVPLFKTLGLGAVPGLLMAGILVGPSGLGLIDNVGEIGQFAEFGVVLLLFVIAIELKPSRLWLMRRLVFGLGTLQVLVTGLLFTAVAYYLLDVSLRSAILIGPALALRSCGRCSASSIAPLPRIWSKRQSGLTKRHTPVPSRSSSVSAAHCSPGDARHRGHFHVGVLQQPAGFMETHLIQHLGIAGVQFREFAW